MNKQYHRFSREQWAKLPANQEIPLTKQDLQKIKSLNDYLSIVDVREVYAPLIQLLSIYLRHHQGIQDEQQLFLHKNQKKIPFLIGITGSVSVGKSTTARLLKKLLSWYYPKKKIDLMTTDGFLYPTKELKKRNLLQKKGFPETYQTNMLINTLIKIKSGIEKIEVPIYSHEIYDVIENQYQTIEHPDILIVEGINVLQSSNNQQIYLSDFFDFSIYIDAQTQVIKKWYLERFSSLLEIAKNQPNNYYFNLANGNLEDAFKIADDAWQTINQPNLENFILPTKNHAHLILHKSENHIIDELLLRKY